MESRGEPGQQASQNVVQSSGFPRHMDTRSLRRADRRLRGAQVEANPYANPHRICPNADDTQSRSSPLSYIASSRPVSSSVSLP
jgi:hypothetical protein